MEKRRKLQKLEQKQLVIHYHARREKVNKYAATPGEARDGKAAELSVCLDFLVLLHQGKRTRQKPKKAGKIEILLKAEDAYKLI